MNELEKLLNKLIELGLCALFGRRTKEVKIIGKDIVMIQYNELLNHWCEYGYSLNDLCSIDSGIWQFVCEKRLHNLGNDNWLTIDEQDVMCDSMNPLYWICKSAVQSDKSKFLLDNIMVEGTKEIE